MPRSMFTSSFNPRRMASLGRDDFLEERKAAKKAAMQRICALTSDWRKAEEGSADQAAWKKSIQQALLAYANKFYDGDVTDIDFRTDVIVELDRCVPRALIPADWVRKWQAIWNQLDRPGPTAKPGTVTPSRPPRATSMQPSAPVGPTRLPVATQTRMPTAQLAPMPTPTASLPARMAPSTPQYSVDLQRQLDSYSQKLQDFYGTATPTAAVRPATPTAPVSMAPAQPRDPYNLTPRFQAQSNQYNLTPPSMRPSVATCPQGQIPDGRGGCRNVGQMPSLPGGLPMDAGAVMSPAALAPAMPSPTFSMGHRRVPFRRRRPDGSGEVQWWGYQQTFIPELYFARPRANVARLAQLPIPEGICCQATQDGGAICSNGQGFPPTCPNKPVPNVPGVAEYVNQGGYMVPKPPVCSGSPAAPSPTPKATTEGGGLGAAVGLGLAGALLYAATELL